METATGIAARLLVGLATRARSVVSLVLLALPLSSAFGQAPAVLYYIEVDHLNTPRAIYDQNQQLVWRWDPQEPFGDSPPNDNPSGLGAFECNLRLPGQYFDKETNLTNNYFRDFDPGLGRYMQADPIGTATTWPNTRTAGLNHLYAYVDSNPISYFDPVGFGKTGAAVGGAIGGTVGAITGGILGGTGGAVGGTLVAPGVGTIGGGALGGAEGTAIGGLVGAGIGAIVGSAFEDFLIYARGAKEQGRNWATEEAKRRAQGNCNTDPCKELDKMLDDAKRQGDTKAVRDIIQAQKFLHCRNVRKRDSHY